MDCRCPDPQLCQRLGMHITPGRMWEIWTGRANMPEAHMRALRARWSNQPEETMVPMRQQPPCAHIGAPTGEVEVCGACKNGTRLKLFACALFGECTPVAQLPGKACCASCEMRTSKRVPDILPSVPDPLPIGEEQTPPDWPYRSATQERHVAALRKLLSLTLEPDSRAGDGVVIVGGGKYWLMAVVGAKMTREVTDLPIQIWHRGIDEPVDPADVEGIPDLTLHDASQYPHRILRGWEAKTMALLHCGFERVIYLDADAYCVADPRPLLDMATPEMPFLYWQDQANYHDKDLRGTGYGLTDAVIQKVPVVQGGQLAIHCRGFWRELVIAYWLNQHSDYFYAHSYGDQDQWRAALALTGGVFRCFGEAPYTPPAFVCAVNGVPTIVHRCQGKTWLEQG